MLLLREWQNKCAVGDYGMRLGEYDDGSLSISRFEFENEPKSAQANRTIRQNTKDLLLRTFNFMGNGAMGTGRRDGSQLNFQITANFSMQSNDLFRWRCAFFKASEIFYNATQGQLRFGNIYVTNDNAGVNNAEYVLDDSGSAAYATSGGFGLPGQSVQCPPHIQEQVLTLLHENGHHIWSLKEEYARTINELVDDAGSLPASHGNMIIPLQDATSDRPDADFAGANARLIFETGLETRTIVSKVGDRITVDSAFTDDPRNVSNPWGIFQWEAECTGDRSTGACIMQYSRDAAGTLDANCNWTPATNPVTEFCTAFNHDPDGDTDQEFTHGEACWDTITNTAGYSDFNAPAGSAPKGMPGGYEEPNWIVLEPNPRFALVLDRSGSMNRNSGARLEGVKSGAAYWLENAAVEGDQLAIIWYNASTSKPLSLTDFSGLNATDVDNLVTQIEAQTASGGTNIRDALLEGLNELISPGTGAAVQASLLMTDGAHNSPWFSSMQEAVPAYQAANTNIYTLGVGSGGELDIAGLENLAQATGGAAMTEADGSNAFEIQARMTEINNLIRGGLVSTLAEMVPDALENDEFNLSFEPETHFKNRPLLTEVADKLGVMSVLDLVQGKARRSGRFYVAYHRVEHGAESATFNLVFQKPLLLWLYLIDPDGNVVPFGSPGTTFVTSNHHFEFAKVSNPKGGVWTIIGLRPENGPDGLVQVVTGIQNKQLAVTARAWSTGNLGPVKVTATARFGRPITGYSVQAIVRDVAGHSYKIRLHDDNGDGIYSGYFDASAGLYRGYVTINAAEGAQMAGMTHAIVHAEAEDKIPTELKTPQFQRSVPISFVVGRIEDPHIPKDEMEGYEPKSSPIKSVQIK